MTLTIYYTDKTSEQFKISNLEWGLSYMTFKLESGETFIVGFTKILEFSVDN
jgi:hypothetical protein